MNDEDQLWRRRLREWWRHAPPPLSDLPLPEPARMFLVDRTGGLVEGVRGEAADINAANPAHISMLREALRWGEPCYRWSAENTLAFALPLTWNQELFGGLVVEIPLQEEVLALGETGPAEVSALAEDLALRLGKSSWLNTSLMAERRAKSGRERLWAEAIHEAKARTGGAWRASYAQWEPELFLAMRRRERTEARRILNRILLAIYSLGRDDLGRIKGFVLDLVNMMARTISDCGADPTVTLGRGFDRLRQLQAIEDEETLGRWVAEVLEQLIDTVEGTPEPSTDFRILLVRNYLREHCGEPLSRDEVAAKIELSPTHFSRLFADSVGRSFSEELKNIRLEKAVRLLTTTTAPIKEIALACGFSDQGYFTRVFRKKMGQPPGSYTARRTKIP